MSQYVSLEKAFVKFQQLSIELYACLKRHIKEQ